MGILRFLSHVDQSVREHRSGSPKGVLLCKTADTFLTDVRRNREPQSLKPAGPWCHTVRRHSRSVATRIQVPADSADALARQNVVDACLRTEPRTVATRHPINSISTARPRLDPHLSRALAVARCSPPRTLTSFSTLSFSLLSFANMLLPSAHSSPHFLPRYVNPRSFGLSFLLVLRFSLHLVYTSPKWKRKREKKRTERGRSKRRSIERKGTVREPIALAVFISRCKLASEGARIRFFTAESAVRSVFGWNFSRGPLSAFSAMKGGIEGKRTGQPVTITTKVCTPLEGRRMRGMTRRETECLASFHLRVIEISL